MLLRRIGIAAIAASVALVLAPWGAAQTTPKYTNAEVVSVDASQRLLVVRTVDGAQQTLELDDNVAGVAELRRGDRVILTLRGEAARPRVQAFSKAAAADTTPVQPDVEPAAPAPDVEDAKADSYARRVADLASQADRVDSLWTSFRTSCNVDLPASAYDGSREWLSLWDSKTQLDLSSGFCRDLFNQVVQRGQSVNAAMAAAETDARRSLEPGRIREIQRAHALDWTGWGRTPPALRQQ